MFSTDRGQISNILILKDLGRNPLECKKTLHRRQLTSRSEHNSISCGLNDENEELLKAVYIRLAFALRPIRERLGS